MMVKITIENKSWRPSIIRRVQENKYVAILPNTDLVIRQEREVFELIEEDIIIEEIEDLDELEEVDLDELEEIEEEIEFEVIDSYFCEFDFKMFLGWIQIGKYLIPENEFRKILLETDERVLRKELRQEIQAVRCLMKGSSTKDLLIQKELLGINFPVPIKITKQLESEIKKLGLEERKSLGSMVWNKNLRNADWKYMTVTKIRFFYNSLSSFTHEESRLSLKKLRELENKKLEEQIKKGDFKNILQENPKKGCKFLDKIKHPIKNFLYKKEDYIIRSPKSYMELYNEGLRMQNCIGKLHLAPIAQGEEIPLFLEKKGVIVAHLLLNKYKELEEVRMIKNRNPSKKIEKIVDSFAVEFGLELEYKNQYGYHEEGFIGPFF